jgi:hypothetical protein
MAVSESHQSYIACPLFSPFPGGFKLLLTYPVLQNPTSAKTAEFPVQQTPGSIISLVDSWRAFRDLEGVGGDLGREAVVCAEEFLVFSEYGVSGRYVDRDRERPCGGFGKGEVPCSCDSGRERFLLRLGRRRRSI